MNPVLQPYYLSKWICPTHGHFSARTERPVDSDHPIHCPECKPEFQGQIKGHTTQSIPYVSRPRVPRKTDTSPIASDNAPLRKRGKAW